MNSLVKLVVAVSVILFVFLTLCALFDGSKQGRAASSFDVPMLRENLKPPVSGNFVYKFKDLGGNKGSLIFIIEGASNSDFELLVSSLGGIVIKDSIVSIKAKDLFLDVTILEFEELETSVPMKVLPYADFGNQSDLKFDKVIICFDELERVVFGHVYWG